MVNKVIERFNAATENASIRSASRKILVIVALIFVTAWGALASETTLITFSGKNGVGPGAPLTFDAAGNLYGTTPSGGPNGNGVVFKLTPLSHGRWKQTLLYSFPTAHYPKGPWGPFSSVVFDVAGNLYGTTFYGGASTGTYYCPMGCGTVYRLTPTPSGPWKETTLYSFHQAKDGGNPNGSVVFDSQGNLYGTTTLGGTVGNGCPNGCGTLFELTPASSGAGKFTVVHSFAGTVEGGDGSGPLATLTLAAGNLYGTTLDGGAFGAGTVFELSPNGSNGWSYSVIHSFPVAVMKGVDGAGPLAGVIADAAGNLYGATLGGGYQMLGAIFMLTHGSGGWTSTLLYSFQGLADGCDPASTLVFDQLGNLYGTVVQDASYGQGGVFELSPSATGAWTETVPLSFDGTDGSLPYGAVILDNLGNVFGSTESGGTSADGVVFELTK